MKLDLDRLAAAKLWLISEPTGSDDAGPRDLAYLSQALYALTPVARDDVERMTCDERWRVYIDPEWLATASVPEVGAGLAHLTWHLLADHASRARGMGVDRATSAAWTRAADIAVSHTLDAAGIHPPLLPTAAESALGPGRSAEEYFAERIRPPATGGTGHEPSPGGCGSGADGVPRSEERGEDVDLGEVNAFDAREIRRRVAIELRDREVRRGSIPGDALRWAQEVLEPPIRWEPVLASAVRRAAAWAAGRGDYTYSRPSRRAAAVPGIVMPGQHRPVPRVSLVVDTSASVDDALLGRALAEVDGVIGALGIPGASVTLYSVDAAVHASKRLRAAKDARLVGAGGTDLRVGLAAAERERPRPDVVVVLTDGDTPWPRTAPRGCVVVVALLGRRDHRDLPPTPPWAVRVECLLERW